jgi:hypothetical protein
MVISLGSPTLATSAKRQRNESNFSLNPDGVSPTEKKRLNQHLYALPRATHHGEGGPVKGMTEVLPTIDHQIGG